MDMCQEMSHMPPSVPDAMPATIHQTYQGTDKVLADACSAMRTCAEAPMGMVCAMPGGSRKGSTRVGNRKARVSLHQTRVFERQQSPAGHIIGGASYLRLTGVRE